MKGTRGGPRHFRKPYVEPGLLFSILNKHKQVLNDLKAYEHLSSGSGVEPKALVLCSDLVKELVSLEPSCELSPKAVRMALLSCLQQDATLNNTKYNGQVWASLRCERIGVLLTHMRKLARAESTVNLAAKLTSLELSKLTGILDMISLKEPALGKAKQDNPALGKGEGQLVLALPDPSHQGEPASSSNGPKRRLKKELSEVSVDSQGFPKLWKSSPQKKTAQETPAGILGKRKGPSTWEAAWPKAVNEDLGAKMGYLKGCQKKPASKCKKGPALGKAVEVDPDVDGPGPWVILRKTVGYKPPRVYLTGTKNKESKKPKLIVEVTKARSANYMNIIETIRLALQKHHITKEQAKAMRERLCSA